MDSKINKAMDIQKAIKVIDIVTTAITDGRINTAFVEAALLGKLNINTCKQILNKWENAKSDYFGFYLSEKDDVRRWTLEALGIEVEPDKFPDDNSRFMAQFLGNMKRSNIYPFETEIVNVFFLFGYSHSLQELKRVSPSVWLTVQEKGIDLYGNYKNWSLFWSKAKNSDKESLLKYIVLEKVSIYKMIGYFTGNMSSTKTNIGRASGTEEAGR